ncbi:acyl-CoA dehydrogenase family protein [Kocuria marina]|uniref:acyl-CoA dehydrogenase family protein n=1 Tax=Kocuria marina TaxID=223184 RepID=UPI0022E4E8E0|nr:acyl-CoA dehydrogenase family protein [Kocuria marina]
MSEQPELPVPAPAPADPRAVQRFVDHALERALELGRELPAPGEGATRELWRELTALGRTDLAYARIIEPHLDALAILRQAGRTDLITDRDTWGVWAAEGPGEPLRATPSSAAQPTDDDADDARDCAGSMLVDQDGRQWTLTGTKPWCSLAGSVTRAVVTAHVTDEAGEPTGHRRAFVVAMDHPGFHPEPAAGWTSHGLAEVVTVPVRFEGVPAQPLGADEWYLTRPGFAWGGMGVAAVWLGGAQSVADLLWRKLVRPARPVDDAARTALGQLDLTLGAAQAVLDRAAAAVDRGEATGEHGAAWALRVRRTVADAAETVIRVVSRATGPGPLTGDPAHVRRVESLQVYIRQDHAERDTAALGRTLLELVQEGSEETPW